MEKEHKRHLEQRINSMQSQLLIGGHKVEDMPAFRSLLKKEQRRIRSEYEERLRELEKERQHVEQDKAQVCGWIWGTWISHAVVFEKGMLRLADSC